MSKNELVYNRFVEKFKKKWKLKKIAEWQKYAKLARIGKVSYSKALAL